MMATLDLKPGEVGLFGYGSLLLKSSMERTLGRPYPAAPLACQLRGWRRTWNSLYPNEHFYYVNEGERRYPKNILYLNVSRDAGTLNGVLYAITEDDLREFDRREAVYTRVDVRDDLVDVEVRGGSAWMYVGIEPYLLAGTVSRDEAAVRRSYIDIVNSGLDSLGTTFRRGYEQSTDPPPPGNIVDDRQG